MTEWPSPDSELWASEYGVWMEACHTHKAIRPRETIDEARERRASGGRPPLDRRALMMFMSWADLRPLFLDATHRGHAIDCMRP